MKIWLLLFYKDMTRKLFNLSIFSQDINKFLIFSWWMGTKWKWRLKQFDSMLRVHNVMYLLSFTVVYYVAIWCTFQSKLEKTKKNPPPKKFLIFREMELSNSKIKIFIIFSQKKAFLIFLEMEPCTFQPKLQK